MTEIIAVVNQKGGVGKTTTSINVAACLASLKKKVLLIDADHQGNCSSGLGIAKQNLEQNFYHFLMQGAKLNEVLKETEMPGLQIIPANRDLLGLDLEMMELKNRDTQLRRRLEEELNNKDSERYYDFIIIDSTPNLNILSINIMSAANRLLIPLQAEYLSLEGLADLIETYKRIKETLNPSLSILGILITMYSSNNNLSKEVAAHLKQHMGDLLLKTFIPRNVRVAEAPSYCQPVIVYDPKSTGAVCYQQLTNEILDIIGKTR